MYRRLPALAAAALLCATAACSRTGDVTGPGDSPLSVRGGAVYDEVDDNGGTRSGGLVGGDPVIGGGPSLDTGGMFGNGN